MSDLISKLDKLIADLNAISDEVKKHGEGPEWYRLNAAWCAIDDARRMLRERRKTK